MSKFCGNCGAQMDDDAKVCGQCGTPIGGNVNIPILKIADSEKTKKRKKTFKIIIMLVMIAVISVGAVNVVSKFTGYNALLREVMSAYERYDMNQLISLSSDIYYYGDEEFVEDYYSNSVGPALEYFESTVGHSYKFSYKVNETYTMSGREKEETLKNIEYTCPDFDVTIIEEIVVSNITITAKQSEKSAEKELNVAMIKEDGDWKLLSFK